MAVHHHANNPLQPSAFLRHHALAGRVVVALLALACALVLKAARPVDRSRASPNSRLLTLSFSSSPSSPSAPTTSCADAHCALRDELLARVHELAAASEEDDDGAARAHALENPGCPDDVPRGVNRPFLSDAGSEARRRLLHYMRDAGMRAAVDGAGNVVGVLECQGEGLIASRLERATTSGNESRQAFRTATADKPGVSELEDEEIIVHRIAVSGSKQRKVLVLGSHYDTVANGGAWDGAYGVLAGIAVAKAVSLRDAGGVCSLPFDIHVVGFDDEEGNNPFGTTNTGAKAYSGQLADFDADVVPEGAQRDAFLAAYGRQFGVTAKEDVWDALKSAAVPSPASRLLAFLELHIEQGPVLVDRAEPVGVVGAIAGQTRMSVAFAGTAGHAGTVPMRLRQDALVAAAGCVSVVHAVGNTLSDGDIVATVGTLNVAKGSTNVVPGCVSMSLDVRSPYDALRVAAVREIQRRCEAVAAGHGVEVRFAIKHEADSVSMAPWLRDILGEAMADVTGSGHFSAQQEVVLPQGTTACTGADEEVCIGGACEERENRSRSDSLCSSATDGAIGGNSGCGSGSGSAAGAAGAAASMGSAVGVSKGHRLMTSGAGHDSQYMARITSAAMLFVRCKGGISHTPYEHVDADDATAGAITLLRAVERLAEREADQGRQ